MHSSHQTLRFSGSPAGFEQASTDIRAALDACGVRGRARHNGELVFEEIVSNVIRHGQVDGRTPHIDVSLSCQASALIMTFADDGKPFDPLQRPHPTPATSLEAVSVGGFGILLVRKASTDLRYERTSDGRNRLTVTIATS